MRPAGIQRWSVAAAIVLALLPQMVGAEAKLTVFIHGLADDTGVARVILFDSRSGYEGNAAPAATASVAISDGQALWDSGLLASGEYALIVHHDRNANDTLDRWLFQLPLEPYGFSGRTARRFGVPDYGQVRFRLIDDANSLHTVHVHPHPLASVLSFAHGHRYPLVFGLVIAGLLVLALCLRTFRRRN